MKIKKFYADWCGPCKLTAPGFAKMFKNYNLKGVVALAKENVELGLSRSVQVIPTFQYFVPQRSVRIPKC